MQNTIEVRESIKVLNLGIGSHCLVDNIEPIGPRVFRSNRAHSSGVGRGGSPVASHKFLPAQTANPLRVYRWFE